MSSLLRWPERPTTAIRVRQSIPRNVTESGHTRAVHPAEGKDAVPVIYPTTMSQRPDQAVLSSPTMNRRNPAPLTAVSGAPISPTSAETGRQAEQEPAEARADDADHDVAEQAQARAAHQQSGKPAGDGADERKADQQADDEAGEVLRLRGKGLPVFGRRGRGDLNLRIEVRMPKRRRVLAERDAGDQQRR